MDKNGQDAVLQKAQALAESISLLEEVQLFQNAEKKIADHQVVQNIIREIKQKQQELVNAKYLKKSQYVKKLEDELDTLNQQLHSIPLVEQYQQAQAETNFFLQDLLRIIKENISLTVPIEKD